MDQVLRRKEPWLPVAARAIGSWIATFGVLTDALAFFVGHFPGLTWQPAGLRWIDLAPSVTPAGRWGRQWRCWSGIEVSGRTVADTSSVERLPLASSNVSVIGTVSPALSGARSPISIT